MKLAVKGDERNASLNKLTKIQVVFCVCEQTQVWLIKKKCYKDFLVKKKEHKMINNIWCWLNKCLVKKNRIKETNNTHHVVD